MVRLSFGVVICAVLFFSVTGCGGDANKPVAPEPSAAEMEAEMKKQMDQMGQMMKPGAGTPAPSESAPSTSAPSESAPSSQ
jgi:hypothetical protein